MKIINTLLFLGLIATTNAATIASFDFNADANSTDTELNSTATVSFLGAAGISGGNDNAFLSAAATGADLAAALVDTDYISVTITAAPDYVLNLTGLTFDYGATVTSGGPYNINSVVVSDQTGSTALVTTSLTDISSTTMSTGNTLDLSGAEFQDITSVTFEFRNWDNTDLNALIHRYDNIVIAGDVVPVVPEPSSIALLGLAGLGLVFRHRRN